LSLELHRDVDSFLYIAIRLSNTIEEIKYIGHSMDLEEIFGKFDDFEYRERRPTNKLMEGIGVNDAPFVVQPTICGKLIRHPAYIAWSGMLNRCFNIKYKDKHTTYLNITCCEDWLLFTNFAKWFKENYIEGWQLDKDLLIKDNKIYSPATCLFVPQEINKFLILNGRTPIGNILPIGVNLHNGRFQATINDGFGKINYLGRFDSEYEAHRAWQKAKLERAIAFNFPPLQRVIDQLTFEIENNLETTSL
jgi:hypothetical protein